jgi:hypothetical protein
MDVYQARSAPQLLKSEAGERRHQVAAAFCADCRHNLLRHENFGIEATALSLDPAGDVDGVAKNRFLFTLAVTNRSDDDLPCVDTDCNPDRLIARSTKADIPLSDRGAHRQGTSHRVRGFRGLWPLVMEDSHQSIPQIFLDRPPLQRDLLAEKGQEVLQHPQNRDRLVYGAELCETDHIDEQYRGVTVSLDARQR